NDPEGRLPYPKRGHPQSKIGLGENGMCEERIAENGARAKRKKNPEQSERPFRAACGLPAKIHAVVAPEDGVQGVATLAFRVLAGEYRDKQTSGNIDTKAQRSRGDGERPAAPGQLRKQAVEEDQSWRLREHHEQTAEDEPDQHGAATHPREPTDAEICRKQLGGQRQGER